MTRSAPPADVRGRWAWQRQAVRHTLFAATAVLTCIWFVPAMPESGLDPSWGVALNQAVALGLRFGEDVTFSFGPYVSVYTQLYHPETAALTFAANLYLAASLWLGLAIIGAGRHTWMLAILCATLFYLRPLRDAHLFFPALIAGLAAHRHARAADADGDDWRAALGLALLFAPLGLLPLIKGSSLVLVLAIVGVSTICLIVSGRRASAAAVAVAPAMGSLVWWTAAGQPVAGLPGYVRNIVEVSAAYSAAMSIPGETGEVVRYLIVGAGLLLACLYLDRRSRGAGRALLLAIFGVYLFVAFKAGFVRHDGHAFIAVGSMLLASLCLPLVFGGRGLLLVPFAVWLFVDSDSRRGHIVNASARREIRGAFASIAAARAHWRDWDDWSRARYQSALAAIADRARLPRLPGTVDIYSAQQADLLAAGLKWSPRATIQSYAAYTPELAARNRDHLLGERAPDHVIFSVEPIDGRLPSTEDGASWPALLSHYAPTSRSRQSLILDRRPASAAGGEQPPLRVSRHQFGETVSLPESETPLFAEIDVRPTPLGGFAAFLYKPVGLSIRLGLEGGDHRAYRLIPGMAAGGFVVSPLVESTRDFAMLFGPSGLLAAKRVSSVAVSPDGGANAIWQTTYTMTLRRLAPGPAVDLTDILDFSRFSPEAPADAVVEHVCGGHVDRVNGQPAQATVTAGLLTVEGWVVISVDPVEMSDSVYIVLTDGAGQRLYARTSQVRRPDVADYLKAPQLAGSGFSLTADLAALPGSYSFTTAVRRGPQLLLCSNHKVPLEVRAGQTPDRNGGS